MLLSLANISRRRKLNGQGSCKYLASQNTLTGFAEELSTDRRIPKDGCRSKINPTEKKDSEDDDRLLPGVNLVPNVGNEIFS